MKNLPRIYLDMDGVLFDFVKNIEKTTGLTINQWTKLGRKERYNSLQDALCLVLTYLVCSLDF